MKTNMNNYGTNFGAIRVPTGYNKIGNKAHDICNRIDNEIKIKGRAIYPDCDVLFFRNSVDENMAEKILCKENVHYDRNPIADIADTFATQEWAQTGDSNILLDWYLKFRMKASGK